MIIVDGVLIQSSLRSSNNIGMIDPYALKNPRPQGGISPLSVSSLIFTLSQYRCVVWAMAYVSSYCTYLETFLNLKLFRE
jgi:hypothetical protein